jgi:hypothetical protein
MPLALFLIAAIFLAAAIRGDACGGEQCYKVLFATMKDDFTGANNFFYWIMALFIVGAVGYYRPLRPISQSFMVLIFVVLFLSHEGFPQKFMEEIKAGTGG